MLAELRQLAEQNVRLSVSNLLALGHADLVDAVYRCYGSIFKARRAAGVPEPVRLRVDRRPKWDQEAVLAEIHERNKLGLPLAHSQTPRPLVAAGWVYFGGWKEAIAAAGLDYSTIRLTREPYTRKEILERVRSLAAQQPEARLGDVIKKYPTLSQPAVKLFGSFEAAATAAGLTSWPIRTRNTLLSREDTIAKLRARYQQGEPVYRHAVYKTDSHLHGSVERHFWSWEAALEAAGAPNDSPVTHWDDNLVIEALRDRNRSGLSMGSKRIQREDHALYRAATVHFGSYRAAGLAAGINMPEPQQRWTKTKVIEELRRWASPDGVVRVRSLPYPLRNAARRYFGTMANARAAAGVRTVRGP